MLAQSYSATVTGFGEGDTIDLTNLDYSTSSDTVSVSGSTLTIDGLTNERFNIGSGYTSSDFALISDPSGGTEVVYGAVDSWTGGTGEWNAASGSDWNLSGVPGTNNTAEITASGITVTLDDTETVGNLVVGAGAILDIGSGGSLSDLNVLDVSGVVNVEDHGSLTVEGPIDNSGTIALDSSNNPTNLQVNADGATLSGSGFVAMGDNGANHIEGTGDSAGTDVLTNTNNTIEGAGLVGGNGLGLDNAGTIDATYSDTQLIINTQDNSSPNSSEAGTVDNTGTLEATGSAGLLIQDTAIDNVGGTISAAGGNVDLQNAFITGGTLKTSGSSVIATTGYETTSVLDGTNSNTVSISHASTVDIDDHTSLQLQGAIDNSGTIALDSSNNPTNLQVNADGETLSGSGFVAMGDNGANDIEGTGGSAGTDVLTNAGNTIEGAGTIGGNGLGLVNEGTIDATYGDTELIINTQDNSSPNSSEAGTVDNTGTLEATGSARLLIQDTAIDNVGGTISAAGGDVLLQNAFITGGTLETSGGVIGTAGYETTSVLDGTGGNTVSNTGTVYIEDHTSLQLQGAIDNSGTIELGSSNDPTNLQVNADGATLSGSGFVTMSDNGSNDIQGTGGSAGTDVLTNTDNTIEGAGLIGGNGLGLVNAGTIDATYSDTHLIIDTGTAVNNTGTLEASNGGTLMVDDVATGGGSALIEGGTIDFAAAANVSEITFNNGSGGTTYGEIIFGNEAGINGLNATVNGFNGTAPGLSTSDAIDLAGNWAVESENSSGGNLVVQLQDGSETVTLTFDDFSGTLNIASDLHGGTLITDPPATNQVSPPVSIGGPGNDNFVFHPGLGANAGNFNPPTDTTEHGHFASPEDQYWATSIIKEDAVEYVPVSDANTPPELDGTHWHALHNAFHLH